MKSIIIIIDYFSGKWPEWFPLYLESCRRNPTITWLFHTDCPVDSFNIKNVIFRSMTRDDYIKHVSECLRINFAPTDNYKLCDLKPMRGALFESEIRGYTFLATAILTSSTAISENSIRMKCWEIMLSVPAPV